jgi:hypothetical protein
MRSVLTRRLCVSDQDIDRSTRQLRRHTLLKDRIHSELRIFDLAEDLQAAGVHGIACDRSGYEREIAAAGSGLEQEQRIVGLGHDQRP